MIEVIHREDGMVGVKHDRHISDSKQRATAHYYAVGMLPRRYLCPAIRQHFEFGWDLGQSQPVLLHCVQGVYDG